MNTTDLDLKELELSSILQINGGRLIIYTLPYYPPLDCTQNGCYEPAEYLAMLFTPYPKEDMVCHLCLEHKDALVELQKSGAPLSNETIH